MHSTLLLLLLVVAVAVGTAAANRDGNFTFTGFKGANLHLSGLAEIHPSGILQLTNDTQQGMGQAFFPYPFRLKTGVSFSTVFVFAVENTTKSFGDGLTFALSPTSELTGAREGLYLGLFNTRNNGRSSNHIVAVELDDAYNIEVNDPSTNHVGIDVNGLESNVSANTSYYDDQLRRRVNLTLVSSGDAKSFQVWIDYDGQKNQMSVTIAPSAGVSKPSTPLLRLPINLSSTLSTDTFVGFTSSTGTATASHYILGWSFCINGEATPLDLAKLPSVPRPPKRPKRIPGVLVLGLSFAATIVLLLLSLVLAFVVMRRRWKFAEIREDWEVEYGPHRFSYKELYKATNGFNDRDNFLGAGGFGRVYKGVLSGSKREYCSEVAVKKVSDDSQQGMKEFVSEIASMGRLRHRNLVHLQGYCRRKGEFLLIYDYMPNGSLDRFLFSDGTSNAPSLLNWTQRFHIIKGVAAGLLYLHDGGEQVIIHRDIKAGNVLLDHEMNGKLSDFGLARLYDHGSNPQTTRVVGTPGYIAPEVTTTGRATTATDVYAFGCFLLEITCGRRQVRETEGAPQLLVDWVFGWWNIGDIMEVVDPRMGGDFVATEVEMVLQLGLLCAHRNPESRPSIRQVVQILRGDLPILALPPTNMNATPLASTRNEGYVDDFLTASPSLIDIVTSDHRDGNATFMASRRYEGFDDFVTASSLLMDTVKLVPCDERSSASFSP